MQEPRWPTVGVGGVALRDGHILLVRRGRPPSAGRWSLPGGRVGWGETIAEAVRREILEETGLRVEVGELAGVVERISPDEGFHYIIVDHFVTVTGGELTVGGDALDARWVPLESIEELPLSPQLLESLKDFGVVETGG